MFQKMGVFAEFERAILQERVRSGLAKRERKANNSADAEMTIRSGSPLFSSSVRRRSHVSARLPHGTRGDRLKAARLALSVWGRSPSPPLGCGAPGGTWIRPDQCRHRQARTAWSNSLPCTLGIRGGRLFTTMEPATRARVMRGRARHMTRYLG